jgi:hypothetical protein
MATIEGGRPLPEPRTLINDADSVDQIIEDFAEGKT